MESELKEIDTGSNLLSGSFKFYRFCSADDYLGARSQRHFEQKSYAVNNPTLYAYYHRQRSAGKGLKRNSFTLNVSYI